MEKMPPSRYSCQETRVLYQKILRYRYLEILTVCRCLPVDIQPWSWCRTCSVGRRWVQCAENQHWWQKIKSQPLISMIINHWYILSHELLASAQKMQWGRSSTNSKTQFEQAIKDSPYQILTKKLARWWWWTLSSQNMPARGGFCPSRSFSAAFNLSSLLLRREPVKKCQQCTKWSKSVNSEQKFKTARKRHLHVCWLW